MAKYEIQDDQGRAVQIEIDGEVTPEIAAQAFANYDAIGITQAGPRGSEERRRAQAKVSARNAQETTADISGGSQAGPVLSGLASLAQGVGEFGNQAIAGAGRVDQLLTDAVAGAIRDPLGDILGKNRNANAADALARTEENPMVRLGTSLSEQGRAFYPVNPKQTAANLVGSSIGSVLGTVAAGPLAVPAYAASSFESGLQGALDAGATPERAIKQGLVEAGTGAATEGVLGVVPGLHEAKAGAMRGIVRPTLKSTIGEAIQEPLEGTLNRASAKYVTGSDPNANPLDVQAALMEAAGGAIGGIAAGGAFAAANARDRGNRLQAIRESRSPEAQILRQVETAPIDLPQNALVMELPSRPVVAAPPGIEQFDGLDSATILAQVQQRLNQKRAASAVPARQIQMQAPLDYGIGTIPPTDQVQTPIDQFTQAQAAMRAEAARAQALQEEAALAQQQAAIQQLSTAPISTPILDARSNETRQNRLVSTALESAPDAIGVNPNFSSDLAVIKSFLLEGDGKVNVKLRPAVKQAVERLVNDDKVLDSIVSLVPVDVMDRLKSIEFPSNTSLNNKAVLKNLLSSIPNYPVSKMVDIVASGLPAFLGAEPGSIPARANREPGTAPLAIHGNLTGSEILGHASLPAIDPSRGGLVGETGGASFADKPHGGNGASLRKKVNLVFGEQGKPTLRSEPAAAQSIATSGVGEAASPTASPATEESVFGVRPYRGAPTITRDAYNRVNELVDAGIAKEDPVAKQIRDLDADAENGVKKSAGYEQLSESGKFEATQLYRNKLYQAAVKWADTGKFSFNQSTIAKSVAMDVGKRGAERLAQKTGGEEAVGESATETNITRATAGVMPMVPIQPDTTRVRQDAVGVLHELRDRLGISMAELMHVIDAYQIGSTDQLDDRELAAFNASKATLDKLGAANFSVSALISEPIGQARAQEAVDNWLDSVGNPELLIRVVDDPNLNTPDGRNVAAQIELVPGGLPIITINASQIGSEAEVVEKIWHELLHTTWGDEGVQKSWAELTSKLSEADVRAQLARGYSPLEATMEAAIDAASIRAANTSIRPAWQRFLDSIWQALKKAFGFQSKPANFEALMIAALRSAAGPWNGQQQSRYNQDVAAIDRPYMEAVARGDMAAAQQMVDAAAKAAGYNIGPVYHGTASDFNEFRASRTGNFGPGIYVAFDRKSAEDYGNRLGGSRVISGFAKISNPITGDNATLAAENLFSKFGGRSDEEAVSNAAKAGYDSVVATGTLKTPFGDNPPQASLFSPEQIKSNDPVTYDNAGNVIPLSKRFNPESKDIRYSVANNMYVTQPERFRRIAEEGQTEAVVAQGQAASAIIPESTLKEISDLEAKVERTPAENVALSNLKAVRSIVGVAVVADQIRQANEGAGWSNYRTLDELPDAYKSVAAQSVMATHLYLNQRYNSLKKRQARAAAQIADIAGKLDGLNESRLLALVSNQEADQLLKDLQTMIDLEIGKVGTSAASRTLEELHKASAAVVGLRQKQDAISAALRSIAKEAPMPDFASPEAMKSWIESRQADKSKPQLMTDEVATAIRASLKPGSGLPDRLSLIRALMADTAVAKAQIKDLKSKVGNPKTALKTIIALKLDASSALNQVAKLDRSMERQLVALDGLEAALGVMDRMQASRQYQARVESAFRYGGFKYSGIIRYTDKPNGDQTLVGPSGKEYVVNFTPDYVVEKNNLETIGAWMEETVGAIQNPTDPNYITDPAKRTSYGNMLAFVSRYMTDRRWLNESAWEDSTPVQILSLPLMGMEKAGMLKAFLGDHLDTRFNAYRLIAGRAGSELVKRSRAIDTFGAKAKAFTDNMKEPLAVARRKAVQSHGLDPDDQADLAIWNRKVNSWILSQNQNPGSVPVKVGDSLGESLVATKEDLAFAEMQHKFSRAIGDIYSGAEVDGETKNPESPGLSPEEQLFGLDFSRKAMQYGYAIGRQFSEAGQEHTREWMAARAKDLAEYKRRVNDAPEGTEVPMVWTNREKVADADIEGHVYSHIRESSTDYTSTADKTARGAYREIAKSIRRGTHYATINEVAEAMAPLMATETEEGTVEVGASEAKEALLKALDKDVLNYNRVAELVTQPSNDPTVSDLPKALAAVRSAKGALVKARGKMAAPSYFYDYSLDTDAKRAGLIQMGKQALQISEINAARNMLVAMRAKLAEYDAKIEQKAQQIGRNGKKVGTWAATRELEADLRKKFKAGELQITYTMLKRLADKLETLSKDREEALSRQRIMEEEAFKVSMLNFTKGAVASTLLSMPAPIINNLTAVVLDPLRAGLMHGDIGLAFALYSKQAARFLKYAFQRSAYKLMKKLGSIFPKKAQDAIAELSANLFSDMLQRRQELEDSGTLDAAESFSATWSRYRSNPLSFGDTTRAKETATSRAISGLLTSPLGGFGLIPAVFEYIRQRAPGSGDRAVNQMNSMIETELSNRIKSKLWLWVNSLEGSTPAEKAAAASSTTIKPEDLGMTKENLSNYRTTYDSTGSLERLAVDYYLRNPSGAKGDLLTKAQRESVVFELISLTNKEVDSTRAEITKGGAGMAGAGRSLLYLFQRYALQLLGNQRRTFGLKSGAGWERDLGQAVAYLFMLAMTLATGALVLPAKQLARTLLQREPLTSPTIAQVAENPELVGRYLTAAAGGVMPLGASLVGAAFSGQPIMGPISANVLENNPVIGAANNIIGAAKGAYESGDLVYPALDFARKQLWFTQPIINSMMPGDAASREAKRAVRTGAVGMEVRESGGAPAAIKSTPMTPIVRDAVAAIYEKDDAKFQAAKQRGIDYLVGKGLSAKEAEKRFNASISGRDPFRSVLGTNPTEEQVSTIIGRSSPGQRTTLTRAREGFSLRKKSKSRGLKLRKGRSGSSRLRRARKPARLRKSSAG